MTWTDAVTSYLCALTPSTAFVTSSTSSGLRDILGHANIATTSCYLHPDATQVQEMVEEW